MKKYFLLQIVFSALIFKTAFVSDFCNQFYQYKSSKFEINIQTDNSYLSENDSILVNVNLKNISSDTLLILQDSSLGRYYSPDQHIVTLDFGELLSSSLEYELELDKFLPNEEIILKAYITFSEIISFIDSSDFYIDFGLGYINSIKTLQSNKNYSIHEITIEKESVKSSSVVVMVSMKKLHVGGIRINLNKNGA